MVNQEILPADKKESEDIERLIVLPFKKSIEISLKSIRVRFFRSLITTMSLVLAVSFLGFVRVSNDVANGMLATQDRHLRQAVIRSGYDLGPEDTNVGASPKQRWIIILSLLVCVVGIVNAQLMAVTEGVSRNRYHEMFRCPGSFYFEAIYSRSRHAGFGRGGCGRAGRRFFCPAKWHIAVRFRSDDLSFVEQCNYLRFYCHRCRLPVKFVGRFISCTDCGKNAAG